MSRSRQLLAKGCCPFCGQQLDVERGYDFVADLVRCACGGSVSGHALRAALPPPPTWQERFVEAFADAARSRRC